MVGSTTRARVRQCLNDVDFPANKNLGEVLSSVRLIDVDELGENRDS